MDEKKHFFFFKYGQKKKTVRRRSMTKRIRRFDGTAGGPVREKCVPFNRRSVSNLTNIEARLFWRKYFELSHREGVFTKDESFV